MPPKVNATTTAARFRAPTRAMGRDNISVIVEETSSDGVERVMIASHRQTSVQPPSLVPQSIIHFPGPAGPDYEALRARSGHRRTRSQRDRAEIQIGRAHV